jgi:hypothetical protein
MPSDPSFDDIPDPTPTLDGFDACAATIAVAVDAILEAWHRQGSRAIAAAPSGVRS